MVRPSLPHLVLLFTLLAPAAAQPAWPDHAPILIETDAMLQTRDGVSGNGVRGGSGTADDPWVISRWTVGMDGDVAGILLRDVQGHVVLRDITFTGSAGGVQPASIVAMDSPHVRLENVHSGDTGHATLRAVRSGLTVDGLHLTASDPEWPCIQSESGTLTLTGLRSTDACPERNVVDVLGGVLHLEDALVERSDTAVGVYQGASATIRDLTVDARGFLPERSVTAAVDAHGFADLEVDGLATRDVTAPIRLGGTLDDPAPVRLSDLELRATDAARHGTAVELERLQDVRIDGASIVGFHGGLDARGSRVVVDDALVAGTVVAFWLTASEEQPQSDVTVRASTLYRNAENLKLDAGTFLLQDSWWDGSMPDSAHAGTKADAPLHPLPDVPRPDRGVPGTTAAAALLALAALAARRRT